MFITVNTRLLVFTTINLFFYLCCKNIEHKDNMKLDLSTDNLVVYNVTPKIKPKNSEKVRNPNNQQIQKILESIRFQKKGLLASKLQPLFSQKVILQLIPYIKSAISNPGEIYFVVVRKEDILQPFFRFYRTSFYLLVQKEIHLKFIEIEENFVYPTQYTFQDWSQVPDRTLKCGRKQSIYPAHLLENFLSFSFQDEVCQKTKQAPRSEENLNYNHVMLDFQKIDFDIRNNSPFYPKRNTEFRLKELEKLYKKGLITEQEYKEKRKKILEDL